MDLLLVALQTVSAAGLAVIGYLPWPSIRTPAALTRRGLILLFACTVIFIASTVVDQVRTRAAEDRLHERIDALFRQGAMRVMDVPRGAPRSAPSPTAQVVIAAPRADERVDFRQMVRGRVADPSAAVWVVVHPTETGAYWVQPLVTVDGRGAWRTNAYFGRPGIDAGKTFEILAVARPIQMITEGQVLSSWPDADWRSDVVTVTRR